MYTTKPLKVVDAETLQKMIDIYFVTCDKDSIPYSLANLALACGVCMRTLQGYEKRQDLGDIIGLAKTKIAGYLDINAQYDPKRSAHTQFIMRAMYRDIYGDQSKIDIGGQQDNPLKVDGLSTLLSQISGNAIINDVSDTH